MQIQFNMAPNNLQNQHDMRLFLSVYPRVNL